MKPINNPIKKEFEYLCDLNKQRIIESSHINESTFKERQKLLESHMELFTVANINEKLKIPDEGKITEFGGLFFLAQNLDYDKFLNAFFSDMYPFKGITSHIILIKNPKTSILKKFKYKGIERNKFMSWESDDGISFKINKIPKPLIDMYSNIEYETLKNALDQAEWVIKDKLSISNPDMNWALSCYSPQASLGGSTDYKDHRKDSIEDIKKLLYEQIDYRLMQNIQYYNTDEKIFDVVLITLEDCGWTTNVSWKDGSKSYVNELYNR